MKTLTNEEFEEINKDSMNEALRQVLTEFYYEAFKEVKAFNLKAILDAVRARN